mmetsp:Transcript_20188/g.52762  ORF Transcript_20188/g.52762 Transcript_20188/m.52762 type:complete len:281 (-) Transcript_20188:550-1392(-)
MPGQLSRCRTSTTLPWARALRAGARAAVRAARVARPILRTGMPRTVPACSFLGSPCRNLCLLQRGNALVGGLGSSSHSCNSSSRSVSRLGSSSSSSHLRRISRFNSSKASSRRCSSHRSKVFRRPAIRADRRRRCRPGRCSRGHRQPENTEPILRLDRQMHPGRNQLGSRHIRLCRRCRRTPRVLSRRTGDPSCSCRCPPSVCRTCSDRRQSRSGARWARRSRRPTPRRWVGPRRLPSCNSWAPFRGTRLRSRTPSMVTLQAARQTLMISGGVPHLSRSR